MTPVKTCAAMANMPPDLLLNVCYYYFLNLLGLDEETVYF